MKFDKNSIADYIAQFIGTALLISLILLSFLFVRGLEGFTIGVGVAVLVYAFQKFTRPHFNPVITVGALINGKISIVEAIVYIVAQFLGALAAYPIVAWIKNQFIDLQVIKNSGLGIDGLREQIASQLALTTVFETNFATLAFVLEALMAFILVFVVLSSTDKENNKALSGLAIGSTFFVATALTSQITGAALNPFRSFIPAIMEGGTPLSQVWVYVLAPAVGGIIGAVVYRGLNWMKNAPVKAASKPAVKSESVASKAPAKTASKAKAKPAKKAAKKTTRKK
jgi:aquaporin Z